ncbi:hypothetical protein QA861_46310 [Streptomyces sp. B21-083]
MELGQEGVGAALPAEEPPGVLQAVRGEAPVGAHPGRHCRDLGGGRFLLVQGAGDPAAHRVGDGAFPQALPLDHVVETGGDGHGPGAPGLRHEDAQYGGEGGELGGRVLGAPPVADPLYGDPHGAASLVDPLQLDDSFGHPFEGRITGLLVQQ